MNAASIAKTLKTSGQAMTLTRTTPGIFDPITGSPGTPIVKTWTVYGIMKNFSAIQRLAGAGVNVGTLVQSGDRLAVIAADQVKPLPADVIHASGDDWVVLAIDPVNPAGIDLMYTCHVRT